MFAIFSIFVECEFDSNVFWESLPYIALFLVISELITEGLGRPNGWKRNKRRLDVCKLNTNVIDVV